MDKFEQFFKENRLLLDTENLKQEKWNIITSAHKKHKNKKRFIRLALAASIVGILALSTFWLISEKTNPIEKHQIGLLSENETYFSEDENSYLDLIQNAELLIRDQNIPEHYMPMFEGFIIQLKIIDEQYEIYKVKIESDGYNDELIQQVIYNYQLKLSVLQMLQSEINKINEITKIKNDEQSKIPFKL